MRIPKLKTKKEPSEFTKGFQTGIKVTLYSLLYAAIGTALLWHMLTWWEPENETTTKTQMINVSKAH